MLCTLLSLSFFCGDSLNCHNTKKILNNLSNHNTYKRFFAIESPHLNIEKTVNNSNGFSPSIASVILWPDMIWKIWQ